MKEKIPLEKELLTDFENRFLMDMSWINRPNGNAEIKAFLINSLARQREELEIKALKEMADACIAVRKEEREELNIDDISDMAYEAGEKAAKDSFLTMLPPEREWNSISDGAEVEGWNDYRRALLANMDKHE